MCCGSFGERVVVSFCLAAWKAPRFLTGSKWMQGWKRLHLPAASLGSAEMRKDWKLLSTFWWWMRSESVNSALFLLMCHPVSPLASAMKETNRFSYQKLPAQGHQGNGPRVLRYPFSARVSLRSKFFLCGMLLQPKVCLGLAWRQKLWLQSCSAGRSHQHCCLHCFLDRKRVKL